MHYTTSKYYFVYQAYPCALLYPRQEGAPNTGEASNIASHHGSGSIPFQIHFDSNCICIFFSARAGIDLLPPPSSPAVTRHMTGQAQALDMLYLYQRGIHRICWCTTSYLLHLCSHCLNTASGGDMYNPIQPPSSNCDRGWNLLGTTTSYLVREQHKLLRLATAARRHFPDKAL